DSDWEGTALTSSAAHPIRTEIQMSPIPTLEAAEALAETVTHVRDIDCKGEVAAGAELGALQSQVKALMKAVAYVDADAPRLEREARTAWRKKDQGALTHARSTLIDWLTLRDDVAAMKRRV